MKNHAEFVWLGMTTLSEAAPDWFYVISSMRKTLIYSYHMQVKL